MLCNTKKICPQCQDEFACNTLSIENCDCSTIILNTNAQAILKDNFTDCLCISCLQKLNSPTADISQFNAPKK